MHILNRRRFFYVVLGWLVFNISIIESTSTHAKVPLESIERLRMVQSSTSTDHLSPNASILNEEDRIVEAMQVEGYPVETVSATGYTAGVESTGKDPSHVAYGITYAGVPVRRDVYSTIAADLSTYPLGTILYVPGYGYGVVTDIGSAIQGNKIDLYYETVEDVYNEWGKQTVDVYVVRVGNGSITEEEIDQLNEQDHAEVFNHQ